MNISFTSLFSSCFCRKNSITVKQRKYNIKQIIAQGGFSIVYLVEGSSTKRLYAIKKIVCYSADDELMALNEVKIHEKVQHENIIQLLDYELTGSIVPERNLTSQLYLVLPYYERGTLQSELEYRASVNNPFKPVEVLEMFLKICSGVKALHQLDEPIAHRDIKTSNVLLGANNEPILMDLGSAAYARVNITNTSEAQNLQDLAAERCSMPYKAPELFHVEKDCTIDERTDIWSLGCLLYAMCFYKSPFDIVYERGDSVALAVLSGTIKFPENHIYGERMENLILFILKVNPEERPFIGSVIEKAEIAMKRFLISAKRHVVKG